jgi:hypothetical protein
MSTTGDEGNCSLQTSSLQAASSSSSSLTTNKSGHNKTSAPRVVRESENKKVKDRTTAETASSTARSLSLRTRK